MKDFNAEAEDARRKINNYFDKNATTGDMSSSNQTGVSGAVTGVTGTVRFSSFRRNAIRKVYYTDIHLRSEQSSAESPAQQAAL